MMKHVEIYEATIAKWGVEAQHDQAIEECAELIATLMHRRRGKVDEETLIGELADVYLMVGQLIFMSGEERVMRAVDEKITKLRELLEQG